MIGALLGDVWPYIASAVGIIAAFVGAYVKGRKDASDKAAREAAEKRASDLATAKEIRDEIDNDSSDDVRDRLNRWVREAD